MVKGSSEILYKNGFTVRAPEIFSIDEVYGTAWDQITIHGRFFGTSKGKIYLEYNDNGTSKRKVCTVLSWKMDPVSGDSEIVFVVPPMLPEFCNVVVDPYGAIPETEWVRVH